MNCCSRRDSLTCEAKSVTGFWAECNWIDLRQGKINTINIGSKILSKFLYTEEITMALSKFKYEFSERWYDINTRFRQENLRLYECHWISHIIFHFHHPGVRKLNTEFLEFDTIFDFFFWNSVFNGENPWKKGSGMIFYMTYIINSIQSLGTD